MEFIREKIKEKPVSKRKIFLKIGTAVVCGVVFSVVVLLMMMLFMPMMQNPTSTQADETQEETESQDVTEETETTEEDIVIPPNLNLSHDCPIVEAKIPPPENKDFELGSSDV